jgi:hypothetical protein
MSKHQQEQQEQRRWWMPKYLRTPLVVLAILFMALFALAHTVQQFVFGAWAVFMAMTFLILAGLWWDKEL